MNAARQRTLMDLELTVQATNLMLVLAFRQGRQVAMATDQQLLPAYRRHKTDRVPGLLQGVTRQECDKAGDTDKDRPRTVNWTVKGHATRVATQRTASEVLCTGSHA